MTLAVLDIGGTKVAAGRVEEGRLVASRRIPTPTDDPLGALSVVLGEFGPVDGLAVSAAGPLDRAAGRLRQPPSLSPAWHDLPLLDGLAAGMPGVLENDAACAALAEARVGAGAGARDVIYFTLSTGVNVRLVHDGRLRDTDEGEGGHQVVLPPWAGGPPCACGGHGCLESLVGGASLQRRHGVRPADLSDNAWQEMGRWLAVGIANAVTLLDPDVVVLGGGLCAAADRFLPATLATLPELLHLQPVPPVRLGTLGEERNLLGAALLWEDAFEEHGRDPLRAP